MELLDIERPISESRNHIHSEIKEGVLRRLKIVHIVSSMNVGGMEQFVIRLASAQQKLGHTVSIVSLKGGPLLQFAAEQRLNVSVLGCSWMLPRVLKGLSAIAAKQPDIIHAHNPTSIHYAVLGKLVSRARVVMTDHAQTKGIQRTPAKHELRLTDAVVAVSQDTADKAMIKGSRIPLSVIHNGIDLLATNSDRKSIRTALQIAENRSVGIMVASMEKVKRHVDLLKALSLLQQDSFPLTVLIVGNGPERENLEKLANNLNLGEDVVRFLGNRSDVMDLLAASDFFLLPSQMEGLPLSILEAMKQKCPVIAASVGGVPEIITHEVDGLLTPAESPEMLAQTITRLVSDSDLRARLAAAAYKRVHSSFDFNKMTDRYSEIYGRVLE